MLNQPNNTVRANGQSQKTDDLRTGEYQTRIDQLEREFTAKYADNGILSAAAFKNFPDVTPQHGESWGCWRLNAEDPPSLDFADGKFYSKQDPYYVLLKDVSDARGLNDWLEHLHEKTWFRDSNNAGDFVRAVLTIREEGGYIHRGEKRTVAEAMR
jgi:hypothetical protein